jgi:predicted ArsR family transcriptional regulator
MSSRKFTDRELLDRIKETGGQTCTALAKHFGVSRQTMHERLTRLIARELIEYEPGSGRKAGKHTAPKWTVHAWKRGRIV